MHLFRYSSPNANRVSPVSHPTAPEVPPSEVSGGGGRHPELVVTWDVSVWAASPRGARRSHSVRASGWVPGGWGGVLPHASCCAHHRPEHLGRFIGENTRQRVIEDLPEVVWLANPGESRDLAGTGASAGARSSCARRRRPLATPTHRRTRGRLPAVLSAVPHVMIGDTIKAGRRWRCLWGLKMLKK